MKIHHLPIFVSFSTICFTSCGEHPAVSINDNESLKQPVHFGQENPTLYPEMPVTQQNAVVALSTNYEETWEVYGYDSTFCTGAVISPHVILTSAHCLSVTDDNGMEIAVMDKTNISIHTGIDSQDQVSRHYELLDTVYKRNALGQNYWQAGDSANPYDYNLDVAVLILKEPIPDVEPLKLHHGRVDEIINQQVQSVGYGYADDNHDGEYNTKRWWTAQTFNGYQSRQLHVSGQTFSGVDHGDSGSPLIYDFGNGPEVIGNLSTGTITPSFMAYYTPVSVNEYWIRSFINKYDNPACQNVCQEDQCGEINGCPCGNCARNEDCINNSCVPVAPGEGGVCKIIDFKTSNSTCTSQKDCPDGYRCEATSNRFIKYCQKNCTPQSCAADDENSFCLPIYTGDGYEHFCIQENQPRCPSDAEIWGSCQMPDKTYGLCLPLLTQDEDEETLYCYSYCQVPRECNDNEYCEASAPKHDNTDTDDTDLEDTDVDNTDVDNTDVDNTDQAVENKTSGNNKNSKKGCNSQAGDASLPLAFLLATALTAIHRIKQSKIQL